MYKIFLSPSDQVKNTYAVGNTNEAEQCTRIGAKCKEALERCGFSVQLVQYESLASKCAKSDAFHADLHVPIHTNGFDGKVSGTRMICYDLKGEGYKAAKAIFDRLAPITPGKSENISANPALYEIRNPKAPTAYVEADFHDNPAAAQWIIDHPAEIGEAICHGICDYFGVAYIAPTDSEDKPTEDTKDNTPSEWSKEAIAWATENGLLVGDETGNLMLRSPITREQFCVILERFCDKYIK